MIGKLKGTADEINEDCCIIDVGGVGYVAYCSTRTLASLREGVEASLFIETYVREDAIRLYGFADRDEREWFRLLQNNVQGVGAKVALAVLSTLPPSELGGAILSNDAATVARAPGVGKKVAERIISELKNKVPTGTAPAGPTLPHASGREAENAAAALANLGYPKDVAARAVAAATEKAGSDADAASLIRLGLKELSTFR